MVKNGPGRSGLEMTRWQDEFMDALDAFGYVVDRKVYFADLAKKKAKGRRL